MRNTDMKWEYETSAHQKDNIHQILNQLGLEGWELVAVVGKIKVLNDGETEITYQDLEVGQKNNWKWGCQMFFKRQLGD